MKADGGFLLDVARDKAADLVKRLSLYKLRAKVEIRDASSELVVFAMWGDNPTSNTRPDVLDPRLLALGIRFIALADAVKDHEAASNGESVPPADYHAHRISLGVPEGGKDYAFGDAFPHEALFDQLHGVSFEKGCYVGQEVVSRMEHRGTARKRVVPVVAEAPLPATGTEITAGDQLIGTLGSSAGKRGLALLRLDRAAEMKTKGADLMAGPVKSRNRAAAMGQVRPRGGRSPLSRHRLRRSSGSELAEGFCGVGGVHHRGPGAHVDGHAQRFHHFFLAGAMLHRRLGVERDAIVAAGGDSDGECDQFLGLGIEGARLQRGLCDR